MAISMISSFRRLSSNFLAHTATLNVAKRSKHYYLHVGPDGNCWTGSEIFAAKHLQPDYVRSIPIPLDVNALHLESMLEEDADLAKQVYDAKELPVDLSERLNEYLQK